MIRIVNGIDRTPITEAHWAILHVLSHSTIAVALGIQL